MHAHDGTELLLCMPPDGDAPLPDQIATHLDGLLAFRALIDGPHPRR